MVAVLLDIELDFVLLEIVPKGARYNARQY
jgi:hypothetical protein